MARIDIRGDIIPNEYGKYYDKYGYDCVYPKKVTDVIAAANPAEPLDVYINSGGGYVVAAQEIYTNLLQHERRVHAHIESAAYSCAGWIAMVGDSEISPVAMLMVHNVTGGAWGDYHDMEKEAEVLKQMNRAICAAFCRKTGKSLEDMMKIMDEETWLTAKQCVEMGFVNRIMDGGQKSGRRLNASGQLMVTPEMMKKADEEFAAEEEQREQLSREKAMILKDLDLFGV